MYHTTKFNQNFFTSILQKIYIDVKLKMKYLIQEQVKVSINMINDIVIA